MLSPRKLIMALRPAVENLGTGRGIPQHVRISSVDKVHLVKRNVYETSVVGFDKRFNVNICQANHYKRAIARPSPQSTNSLDSNRDNLLPHRMLLISLITNRQYRFLQYRRATDFARRSFNNTRVMVEGDNNRSNPTKRLLANLSSSLLSNSSSSGKLIKMSMFSNILAKFMSTGASSGIPIDSDRDTLLCNTKTNKTVTINACGQLYAKLSTEQPHLYGNAPKIRGINFKVGYYDSNDLLKLTDGSSPPTVCLLHGAPGHYKDFAELIQFLTAKGVRVIAPNFPDYSATYEHSFRHSPRERLDYLLNFFDAIQVRQIDLLIGHSSAVYTMFELLNQTLTKTKSGDSKLQLNSLGLFSTPTYNLPRNMAATPFRMFALKLFDYPILRPIILALIDIFVRLQGIQNRVDSNRIENLLIAASAVGYSESDNMTRYLQLIHKFRLPTFVLIGCNDRLIPMNCFEQLKRDLLITSERQVKQYDHDGRLESNASDLDQLIEISQFASGGHYTFQKFSQQVNEDVYDFLVRKVIPKLVQSTKL